MADDLGYGDVPWNNPYLVEKMPNLHKFRSDGMVIGKVFIKNSLTPQLLFVFKWMQISLSPI